MPCTIQPIIRRKVATMAQDRTVLEAAKLMMERGEGSVVVTHKDQVVGFFTERDLVTRVVVKNKDPHITTLGEVCTHDLVKIQPTLTCQDSYELMRSNKIRHLMVWEQERFIGLIAMRDLAGLMGQKESTRERMVNAFTALFILLIVGVIGFLVYLIPSMLAVANRLNP
ncbi:MAG: CBS domain-containing protein [Magnetococcales bacterium]|nr:CBS domain-containing protein [Magnetococcales bacterium]MBF0156880.1 CBS domain-containing protein [Magnetococcales bacterium]